MACPFFTGPDRGGAPDHRQDTPNHMDTTPRGPARSRASFFSHQHPPRSSDQATENFARKGKQPRCQ